jgi:hypothetical protein
MTFSCDFSLVSQVLYDATGNKLSGPEVIEGPLPVLTKERAIFFIGSMREPMICRQPVAEELASPGGRVVVSRVAETLL